MKGMHFVIQVGVKDCLGCGNCADVCPGNPKLGGPALKMVAYDDSSEATAQEAANWDYCVANVKTKQSLVDVKSNVKNSQFATPLFEFSGACSGCGETPYVKLISQLFGDRKWLPMQQVVLLSTQVLFLLLRIQPTKRVTVRLGQTHCSKTSVNLV